MLTLDKIYQAAFVLKQVARKTDLIYAQKLSGDNEIYLKTENLQVTGSFKLRGAYYKISQLSAQNAVVLGSGAGVADGCGFIPEDGVVLFHEKPQFFIDGTKHRFRSLGSVSAMLDLRNAHFPVIQHKSRHQSLLGGVVVVHGAHTHTTAFRNGADGHGGKTGLGNLSAGFFCQTLREIFDDLRHNSPPIVNTFT